jgi:hypothetical protein
MPISDSSGAYSPLISSARQVCIFDWKIESNFLERRRARAHLSRAVLRAAGGGNR